MDLDTYSIPSKALYLLGSETVKFMPSTLRIVIRCKLTVAMILSHLDVQISQDLAISGKINRIFNVLVTQHHGNH